MDDIISLILVFLIYAVAAASGKKKKNKRRRQERTFDQMRDSAQQSGWPQQASRSESVQEPRPVKPEPVHVKGTQMQADAAGKRGAGEFCHQTASLHLHEVTQAQMQAAGEGEDPCHAGGEEMFSPEPDEGQEGAYLFERQAGTQDLSQDVLRGIIMSEILDRPCQRRVMRRNGRGV